MDITRDDFEKMVAETLDTLPQKFAEKLENVEVVVDIWPTIEQLNAGAVKPGSTLLGLYQGIPQTKRANYSAVLPDKITLFAGPIIALSGNDPDLLKTQVRNTLLHEIGHHFGMNEDEIRTTMQNITK